jgi:hypothetical protein
MSIVANFGLLRTMVRHGAVSQGKRAGTMSSSSPGSSPGSSPHPLDSVADEEDSDNAFAYIEEIVSDTKDCVGDLPPVLQAEARERARAKRINSPVTSAPPHVQHTS